MDSQNIRQVREAWLAFEEGGVDAGLDALFAISRPDLELRPYAAGGRVLRGREEIRSFYSDFLESGGSVKAQVFDFTEEDDRVVVDCSLRFIRADGGIADTQVRWTYRFEDGSVVAAGWEPLGAPAAGRPSGA